MKEELQYKIKKYEDLIERRKKALVKEKEELLKAFNQGVITAYEIALEDLKKLLKEYEE